MIKSECLKMTRKNLEYRKIDLKKNSDNQNVEKKYRFSKNSASRKLLI